MQVGTQHYRTTEHRRTRFAEGLGVESQLQHAIERDVRAGQDRAVLVLHLARLDPVRPYHLRVAKALLDDAARSFDGQVFMRRNADAVLICNPGGVERLAVMLERMFRTDVEADAATLGQWVLPQDSAELEHYLGQTMASVTVDDDASPGPADIGRMAGMAQVTDLIRRQLAVQISGSGIRPAYRELSFPLAALSARADVANPAVGDPYLLRHLAARLDTRIMPLLARQFMRSGRLPPGLPLHIALDLRSILSRKFLRLANAASNSGARLGVIVAPMDALSDPPGFDAARMALQALGVRLVMGPIEHGALMLTRLDALGADLVSLAWSPRLPKLAPAEADGLAVALHRIGADRLVLHGATSAEAMAWGQRHGIDRFQGPHIDRLLATTRLGGCRQSGACSLRQCIDRASSTAAAGRVGCRDTARLDRLPGANPVAA